MSEKEISFKIDWTPEQKKAFKDITGFTEFEDDCIKIEQLLKVVEKQQKELENNKKFKKDIVNLIMLWDKKELPENKMIIETLETIMHEFSRLEDIEDRKIQVAVKFIEEKRDKYWKDKIEEKIKEYEKRLKDMNSKTIGTNKNWVNKSNVDFGIYVLNELLEE